MTDVMSLVHSRLAAVRCMDRRSSLPTHVLHVPVHTVPLAVRNQVYLGKTSSDMKRWNARDNAISDAHTLMSSWVSCN